jgi:hypothetical protein
MVFFSGIIAGCSNNEKMMVYSNETYHYSIQYPESFSVTNDGEVVRFEGPKSFIINILVLKSPKVTNLDEVAQLSLDIMKNDTYNYYLIEKNRTTLGGQQAVRIISSETLFEKSPEGLPNFNPKVRKINFIVVKTDTMYSLSYSDVETNFNSRIDEVERIFQSFKILY